MSKCTRTDCRKKGYKAQGRPEQILCVKHYRFTCMRMNASRNGKTTPSNAKLEALLVASRMKCFHCKKRMVWLRSGSTTRVLTLQHDHDGTLRFLCFSCNSRHRDLPNDVLYNSRLALGVAASASSHLSHRERSIGGTSVRSANGREWEHGG